MGRVLKSKFYLINENLNWNKISKKHSCEEYCKESSNRILAYMFNFKVQALSTKYILVFQKRADIFNLFLKVLQRDFENPRLSRGISDSRFLESGLSLTRADSFQSAMSDLQRSPTSHLASTNDLTGRIIIPDFMIIPNLLLEFSNLKGYSFLVLHEANHFFSLRLFVFMRYFLVLT